MEGKQWIANFLSAALLMSHSLPSRAVETYAGGLTCASDMPTPPAKVETKLGSEVDDIVNGVNRYRGNVSGLISTKWTFIYGESGYADRKEKIISLIRGASSLNMASQLSHEVGHAIFTPHFDESSRDAYVRTHCTDEGAALVENIIAMKTVKQCLNLDIGVMTESGAEMLSKYDEIAAKPPISFNEIGYLFCEKNFNSIDHKNYLDYYGDYYDSHY